MLIWNSLQKKKWYQQLRRPNARNYYPLFGMQPTQCLSAIRKQRKQQSILNSKKPCWSRFTRIHAIKKQRFPLRIFTYYLNFRFAAYINDLKLGNAEATLKSTAEGNAGNVKQLWNNCEALLTHNSPYFTDFVWVALSAAVEYCF